MRLAVFAGDGLKLNQINIHALHFSIYSLWVFLYVWCLYVYGFCLIYLLYTIRCFREDSIQFNPLKDFDILIPQVTFSFSNKCCQLIAPSLKVVITSQTARENRSLPMNTRLEHLLQKALFNHSGFG